MDYEDWGPGPPWYEDLFFAIMGIIFFCVCFIGIILFAAAVSVIIALSIVMILDRMGIVVV